MKGNHQQWSCQSPSFVCSMVAASSAAKEAASGKVSGGSSRRQVTNFSVETGEGRDDVDIARPANCDNKALPRGGSASFPAVRQSKVASIRTTEGASVSSKRSKASELSLSIKTEYINGSKRSAASRTATTKPIEIEAIQIHKSSKRIHNNHSSANEEPPMSRKELQRSELEYWSSLSVRVAMAVIQANGSKKMAQKASNIVLKEGIRQCGRDRSCEMMRALSAKLSVILLEAGANQKVALAVVLAVLADENNAPIVRSAESMLFDDNSTIPTDLNITSNITDELQSVASTLSSNTQSDRSKSISVGPSRALKRSQLNSLELQILEKQKAIEEAALWKQERQLKSLELQILEKQKIIEGAGLQSREREKKFNERIAAYEAVTAERLAALDQSTVEQQDNGTKKGNNFAWWGCFLV